MKNGKTVTYLPCEKRMMLPSGLPVDYDKDLFSSRVSLQGVRGCEVILAIPPFQLFLSNPLKYILTPIH
jgi:hypothetical protein